MSSQPSIRTQFIILVVFGDVIAPRGGRVWTSGLLKLLRLLGVSERAARSALSRMSRKGWLKTERHGRHSAYMLTPRGERLLSEGDLRIFEPRMSGWDGQWHMVVYSLPESRRRLRNDLRRRLNWLGFGRLAPGAWISPNDRQQEVQTALDDLDARPFVQVFSGIQLTGGDNRAVVNKCWDLKALNRRYARFLARWAPEHEKFKSLHAQGQDLSQAKCFVQRFWIAHEYSAFPRLDPNLPPGLLPEGWLGDRAARVFETYRELLSEGAASYVTESLRRPNGRGSSNGGEDT